MIQDVNVVFLDFPNKGKEMVVENEDGTYTVLINARLTHEQQLKEYLHAIGHIFSEDFQKENVQSIEASAHKLKFTYRK